MTELKLTADTAPQREQLSRLTAAICDLHGLVCKAADADVLAQTNVETVFEGVQAFQNLCHGLAARSGWWTDKATGLPVGLSTPRLVPEKLCLIHSEISEAMEGDRKNLMDDKLPHRKMLEVELADAMIRIGDLAGFLGLDLAGAVIEKLAFNQQRPDHKMENRMAPGGKSY